jgi:hypothetical protein
MWEALTAIGTVTSAAVIAITVILAARQVRVNSGQLEQLRRAAQFEAARTVLLEMSEPKFVAAFYFVINELPNRMRDPSFLREVYRVGLADENVHQELIILRAFERVGTYVKYGLLDGEVLYDTAYRTRILSMWERLAKVIALHREMMGGFWWENFEGLYVDCKRWAADHERSFEYESFLGRVDAAWRELEST